MLTIELPWPPSVNHYYRHVGPRVLISRDGKTFRDVVEARLRQAKVMTFTGAVELIISLYPPDNRRRDIDNILKALFDALTVGGLYRDDSQVKALHAKMFEPKENGLCVVQIREVVNDAKNAEARAPRIGKTCVGVHAGRKH